MYYIRLHVRLRGQVLSQVRERISRLFAAPCRCCDSSLKRSVCFRKDLSLEMESETDSGKRMVLNHF